MVVRDDYVHSHLLRFLNFGNGSDAGIDGDDEADASFAELFQSCYLQAVTFTVTVGYVGNYFAAKC